MSLDVVDTLLVCLHVLLELALSLSSADRQETFISFRNCENGRYSSPCSCSEYLVSVNDQTASRFSLFSSNTQNCETNVLNLKSAMPDPERSIIHFSAYDLQVRKYPAVLYLERDTTSYSNKTFEMRAFLLMLAELASPVHKHFSYSRHLQIREMPIIPCGLLQFC